MRIGLLARSRTGLALEGDHVVGRDLALGELVDLGDVFGELLLAAFVGEVVGLLDVGQRARRPGPEFIDVSSTILNSSFAVRPIRSFARSTSFTPGSSTTTRSEPWLVIEGSETPNSSIRLRMTSMTLIDRAVADFALELVRKAEFEFARLLADETQGPVFFFEQIVELVALAPDRS